MTTIDLERLKELQKSGDVKIIKVDPSASYLLIFDMNKMPVEQAQRIKPLGNGLVDFMIGVDGKPDEAIAMFEIKKNKEN